jgi:hypothetical protein
MGANNNGKSGNSMFPILINELLIISRNNRDVPHY